MEAEQQIGRIRHLEPDGRPPGLRVDVGLIERLNSTSPSALENNILFPKAARLEAELVQ